MNLSSAFSLKHRLQTYLIVGLALIISFVLISKSLSQSQKPGQQVENIQKRFDVSAKLLNRKANEVSDILHQHNVNYWPLLERAVHSGDLLLQVYRDDTLIYWNSQKISNEIYYLYKDKEDTVIEQGTGWFLLRSLNTPPFTIFILKQIKTQYDVDNSYLPSALLPDFGSATNIELTADIESAQYTINNLNGNSCIGLNFDSIQQSYTTSAILLFILFIHLYISIILIINKIYRKYNSLIKNKLTEFIVFCIDLIALRFLDFYFDVPSIVKHSFLFIPKGSEIEGLTTIGDLILNSIIFLAIAIKFFSLTTKNSFGRKIPSKAQGIGMVIILGLISFLVNLSIYITINNLEYHALFGIQINNTNGYTALLVVLILTISLFLFFLSFQNLIRKSALSFYLIVLTLLVIGGITLLFSNNWLLVSFVACFQILIAIAILNYPSDKQDIRIIKYISLAILFSIATALLINKAEQDSRDVHQVKMAQLFSNPDDIDLEDSYHSNYLKIVSDIKVKEILENSEFPEEMLQEYLSTNYFSGYSNKYDIQLTICEETGLLELQPDGIIVGCDEYFADLIEDSKRQNGDTALYVLERRPDRIHYLGKISLNNAGILNRNVNIYIQFFFNYVPEGLGYPELLVDNKFVELDLTGYSYAIYKDNQLDYKFGSFAYNTSYSYLEEFPNNLFFDLSGYRHFKLEFEPDHFIVLSRPVARISEQLVTFSLLFLCFICITFITLVAVFGRKSYNQLGLSFRNRLQIIFVTTISFVIAMMAIITLFYLESNNENKIHEQLNEKTYSVIIELEHKLGGLTSLANLDQDYLHDMLRKFSLVFFSDINLYDANGQIIASSRPEIFEKGLLSENINPMAYEELIVKNKLFFTTRESIGTASYYSSYAPFYLDSSHPAGIVNLPYFARQTEVRQAYYLMFFTFINLFVIFGIIGAFVALMLSRIMAKPLFLLQQSIGNLRIDKENERIEWNREDEIGQLIAEYNRMVDKLEQSAELLKHSERESTWREVAQQIAHEIKNPLTPMKLNVQYLEKAYKSNDPGFDAKIKSISESLITQIDTLDKVAEMFSDFAKSNAGNFEKVDLVKIIKSSVLLFDSHSKVKFDVIIKGENVDYFTPAIEKDLLRVFNNLLKNALQAIETKSEGKIEIAIFKQAYYNVVRITDNGKGIPFAARTNIFQPYFTTKSGGTGLGLAIVKNIISETGGEITFETNENQGTVFTLKFKIF